MLTMNAKDAQAHFGSIMTNVIKEPIAIKRYGKTTAVVISYKEYQKFQKLEDLYWSLKVEEAEKEGYATQEESLNILDKILKG